MGGDDDEAAVSRLVGAVRPHLTHLTLHVDYDPERLLGVALPHCARLVSLRLWVEYAVYTDRAVSALCAALPALPHLEDLVLAVGAAVGHISYLTAAALRRLSAALRSAPCRLRRVTVKGLELHSGEDRSRYGEEESRDWHRASWLLHADSVGVVEAAWWRQEALRGFSTEASLAEKRARLEEGGVPMGAELTQCVVEGRAFVADMCSGRDTASVTDISFTSTVSYMLDVAIVYS